MHIWFKQMVTQTSTPGKVSARHEDYQAQATVGTWQNRIDANSSIPIKYWYMWVLHHCFTSLCFLVGILLTETWLVGTGFCLCLVTCHMQGHGPQNGCASGLNKRLPQTSKEGNFTEKWSLSGTGSCLCLARCHIQNRRRYIWSPSNMTSRPW